MLASTAHVITKSCTDFIWGGGLRKFATSFVLVCIIKPSFSKVLLIWVSQK